MRWWQCSGVFSGIFKLDDSFFHLVQFILTKHIAHLITTLGGRSFATSAPQPSVPSHHSVVNIPAGLQMFMNLQGVYQHWRRQQNHLQNSGTPLPREWPAENGSLRKSILNCSRSVSRELGRRLYHLFVLKGFCTLPVWGNPFFNYWPHTNGFV